MDLLYCDELNASLLPFDETLSEQLMLSRVIRDISRFALVKVDQGSNSLQIHRLVQAVIRSQMTRRGADSKPSTRCTRSWPPPGLARARPTIRRTGPPTRSSGRISGLPRPRSATTRGPVSC